METFKLVRKKEVNEIVDEEGNTVTLIDYLRAKFPHLIFKKKTWTLFHALCDDSDEFSNYPSFPYCNVFLGKHKLGYVTKNHAGIVLGGNWWVKDGDKYNDSVSELEHIVCLIKKWEKQYTEVFWVAI